MKEKSERRQMNELSEARRNFLGIMMYRSRREHFPPVSHRGGNISRGSDVSIAVARKKRTI